MGQQTSEPIAHEVTVTVRRNGFEGEGTTTIRQHAAGYAVILDDEEVVVNEGGINSVTKAGPVYRHLGRALELAAVLAETRAVARALQRYAEAGMPQTAEAEDGGRA